MIDVGAHVGTSALPFARSGWTVHAFEPDPHNRTELMARASGLANLIVVPAAVSNQPGRLTLYCSDVSSGISSLSAFHESHRPTGDVDVVTLQDYLSEVELEHVDFLKVDTEGHDFFVLQGFPWARIEPDAVVCEFEDRKTRRLGYTYHDLAGLLVDHRYTVFVSEWHPVVEYGQTHQWRRWKPYPHALAHESAWGNLVAVRPGLARAVSRAAFAAASRLRLRELVQGAVRGP